MDCPGFVETPEKFQGEVAGCVGAVDAIGAEEGRGGDALDDEYNFFRGGVQCLHAEGHGIVEWRHAGDVAVVGGADDGEEGVLQLLYFLSDRYRGDGAVECGVGRERDVSDGVDLA